MIGQILACLCLGVFATIGFCSSIRWCAERLSGETRFLLGIEILTQRDAESAEAWIRDALFRSCFDGFCDVVIFTTKDVLLATNLLELSRKYGVSCRIMSDSLEKCDIK